MTNSPVRFALAGLDHHYWAFDFAKAINSHPDARLVAVGDADLARAQEAASHFGVERVTANLDELIEDDAVDVIASFVSVDQNPRVCIAAARAGKHIFSVKPLARTTEEATEIVRAVDMAGVIFLPAESTSRVAKQYQTLKEWIDAGRFGRILTATISQHAGLPMRWPNDADSGWFIDPERGPGGGWIDHSIYAIDRLRWLFDDEIKSIGGFAGKLKYPELAFEDYGSAIVEFQKGLVATIEVTWIVPPHAGRSHWVFVGTEGGASYDSLTGRLSIAGNFAPFQGWMHTAPQAMHDTGLDHMIACVLGTEQPVANVHDAWRNLAACAAFYRGAAAGTSIMPEQEPKEGARG